MTVFLASTGLVRLVCPHCGEVQARPPKAKASRYACRVCHRRFTRDEGQAKGKRPGK